MNEITDIRQRDSGLTSTASNDRSVGKVAMEAIQRRIEDLQQCCKLVLQSSSQEVDADESVHKHADESVHKLRVSLRRTIAALEFFREWVPGHRFQKTRASFKKLLGRAGNVRDLDLMIIKLRSDPSRGAKKLLYKLSKDRDRLQQPLLHLGNKYSADHFVSDLIAHLFPSTDQQEDPIWSSAYGPWAIDRIQKQAEQFMHRAVQTNSDNKSLHRLRIIGKKLRYGLELLEPIMPDVLASPVYAQLKEIQALLGEIHDLTVRKSALKIYRNRSQRKFIRDFIDQQIRKDKVELKTLLARWNRTWSFGQLSAFERNLRTLLRVDCRNESID